MSYHVVLIENACPENPGAVAQLFPHTHQESYAHPAVSVALKATPSGKKWRHGAKVSGKSQAILRDEADGQEVYDKLFEKKFKMSVFNPSHATGKCI